MAREDYRIEDHGELHGDVLLFGGVYSNLEAVQALFEVADTRGIPQANRVCTGDVVAYCADPQLSFDRVLFDTGIIVSGNCEKQIGAGASDCGCGFQPGSSCELASQSWFPFATQETEDWHEVMGEMTELAVFKHAGKRYAVIHGGMTDVSRYLWPVSPEDHFREEIDAIQVEIGDIDGVIAGHCGIAFEKRIDDCHWINPGAIGMPPNDGHSDTRYAILSESGLRIERLPYAHYSASASMEAAGLTQGYEKALGSGYWPSEEILPRQLRKRSA